MEQELIFGLRNIFSCVLLKEIFELAVICCTDRASALCHATYQLKNSLLEWVFFTLILFSMIIRHLREVSSDKRTVTNVSTSYTRKTQLFSL